MHKIKSLRLAAFLALTVAAGTASAQSMEMLQGLTVYVGGAYIDVHSKADPLTSAPPTLPPGVEAGVRVGDAGTVGFGVVYRFAPAWSVEAALGVPPEHSGYGTQFIEPFGQISTVKQVAPTFFLNYHFNAVMAGLSPFVGVGFNYTKFTDAKSTASGNAASGGPTSIDMTDSWGVAAHVGLTYQIDRNWSIVGTIAYADVSSDMTATTTTNAGNIVRTTTIDFRPVVYTLSVGYTF
ncbi:OmpW/AlkL family protein [Rivibacter subsaxonicus]|uniref:Outer membrane protein n=1 Tax=Rivibacter subsaxonicus TaxID=457575 RepID=A0A4Q7VV98_9BURK|nr:OmpW family outer membrane protein [Rivibacter subsaxonicus]RZU00571.1 outer membrane protein [Rivibacter subsaxonicus]